MGLREKPDALDCIDCGPVSDQPRCPKCNRTRCEHGARGRVIVYEAGETKTTCEKCGACEWRPADGNGGGGGRGCICPKADMRGELDYRIREANRLLRWAARELEKHGVNADNWYADYQMWECFDITPTDHLAQRGLIVRDGWVAVPREPTDAMRKAGWEQHREDFHCNGKYDATNHYRAMIASAPKPDDGGEG